MNYCTLFNSAYLSRGLALYQSLKRWSADFHLYIFAFDDAAYQILTALQLPYVTVISLKEFETPALLAVKPSRSMGEYCWTCTSSTILHCLEKYHLDEVCYLDADLYFWGDPKPLIAEARQGSILITEHRYTPEYDNSALSGKYCVQFMYFKHDVEGLNALHWWRDACIDWCYNRVEPGRFGDQKYLDDWVTRFDGVTELQHLGGGLAPWNIQQYKVYATQPNIIMKEISSGKIFPAIFYHFHALKFINQHIDFGTYRLDDAIQQALYLPYVKALLQIEAELKQHPVAAKWLTGVNLHAHAKQEYRLIDYLRIFKKKIQGIYNTLPLARLCE